MNRLFYANKVLNITFTLIIAMLLISMSSDLKAQDTTMHGHEMESQDTSMSHDHHGMMGDMQEEMKEMHEKMKELEMTGDPDYDFAQMMIEHHKGAITLSEKQVEDGEADTLISMAKKIIEDQEAEIDSLENFVSNHEPDRVTEDKEMTGGGQHLMGNMDDSMQDMLNMEVREDQDHNYVQMITMHHQQAIDMATNYLSHGKDENLKKMAQDMIDKSKEEIDSFENWKNTHD